MNMNIKMDPQNWDILAISQFYSTLQNGWICPETKSYKILLVCPYTYITCTAESGYNVKLPKIPIKMYNQILSDLNNFVRKYFLWCYTTKVRSERLVCGCQTFWQYKKMFLLKTDLQLPEKTCIYVFTQNSFCQKQGTVVKFQVF